MVEPPTAQQEADAANNKKRVALEKEAAQLGVPVQQGLSFELLEMLIKSKKAEAAGEEGKALELQLEARQKAVEQQELTLVETIAAAEKANEEALAAKLETRSHPAPAVRT